MRAPLRKDSSPRGRVNDHVGLLSNPRLERAVTRLSRRTASAGRQYALASRRVRLQAAAQAHRYSPTSWRHML